MPAPQAAGPGRSAGTRVRREIDAVMMLTVYLVLLLAIPSGVTIGLFGSIGRPSLIWGLILMGWWVIARLQSQPAAERPLPQPVRFALTAFIVIVLVSYAAAMLRGQPGDQVSPALTAVVRLLSWSGVLLVAVDGIRTLTDLSTIVRRIGIGAGLLAVLGILQFITGQALVDFWAEVPGVSLAGGIGERAGVVRASGTAIHPLEYATALSATLPLVIAAAISKGFRSTTPGRSWKWWLPVVLIAISSLIAVSRSAIIGFGVALISMIPALPGRIRSVVIAVGATMALAVYAAVPGLLTTTITLFTGAADDPSTQSRAMGLERVPEFMSTSPLIGSGFGIFLPRYYIFDNQWVLIAIELGVLGFIAFAGIFVTGIGSALDAKQSPVPDVRLLGHALAASLFIIAVLFAFFDGLSFPIAGGMLFMVTGLCGSVRAIARGGLARQVITTAGSAGVKRNHDQKGQPSP